MTFTIRKSDLRSVQQQWTGIAHNLIGVLLLHALVYFHYQSRRILRSIEKLDFKTASERKGQESSQQICLNLVAKATVKLMKFDRNLSVMYMDSYKHRLCQKI